MGPGLAPHLRPPLHCRAVTFHQLRPEHLCLIVATDGVWEVCARQPVSCLPACLGLQVAWSSSVPMMVAMAAGAEPWGGGEAGGGCGGGGAQRRGGGTGAVPPQRGTGQRRQHRAAGEGGRGRQHHGRGVCLQRAVMRDLVRRLQFVSLTWGRMQSAASARSAAGAGLRGRWPARQRPHSRTLPHILGGHLHKPRIETSCGTDCKTGAMAPGRSSQACRLCASRVVCRSCGSHQAVKMGHRRSARWNAGLWLENRQPGI